MNQTRYIIEVNLKTTVQNIYIIHNVSYRQSISWDAFFSYKHNRNRIDGYEHFFKAIHYDELESEMRRVKEMEKIIGDQIFSYNFINCDGLYNFFKKVGYDREKKKFVNKTGENV